MNQGRLQSPSPLGRCRSECIGIKVVSHTEYAYFFGDTSITNSGYSEFLIDLQIKGERILERFSFLQKSRQVPCLTEVVLALDITLVLTPSLAFFGGSVRGSCSSGYSVLYWKVTLGSWSSFCLSAGLPCIRLETWLCVERTQASCLLAKPSTKSAPSPGPPDPGLVLNFSIPSFERICFLRLQRSCWQADTCPSEVLGQLSPSCRKRWM